MGVGGGIVSYVMIWWLVLFNTLPLRPKSVWEEPEEHAKGSDRGAPVDPALWRKIKLTTMIATPIWFLVFLVITSGILAGD
jgi:predicted secreted protein